MKSIFLTLGLITILHRVHSQNSDIFKTDDYLNTNINTNVNTNANTNVNTNINNSEVVECKDGEDCVQFYQCKNNVIIKDGNGFLDIRAGFCQTSTMTCCSINNITDEIIVPPTPPIPTQCGLRNPNGVIYGVIGNNNEAHFGEFPWQILIFTKTYNEKQEEIFEYVGGGSLIHESVVLTAAHKIANKPANTITARAGEWDTKNINELTPYQDVNVAEIIIHPEFNPKNLYNDIGLMFLSDSFKLAKHIFPICLPPPNRSFDLQDCLVAGWGKKTFLGRERAVILKKIDLPTVSHSDCQEALRKTRLSKYFELHNSFMCAGGELGKDACIGDGGSPLVCPITRGSEQYFQAGIVAWGIGCGEESVPGVYVKVSLFRTWIDDQMISRGLKTSSYEADVIPRREQPPRI